MVTLRTALLLVFLLAAGGTGPAFADAADRKQYSLKAAVEQARRQSGGRVLSAETVKGDGGKVHRIKVLTADHRVQVFEFEAKR